MNPILLSDSYKYTHNKQTPPNTKRIFSYFESRNGAKWPYTVFFGLTHYLNHINQTITMEDVNEAEEIINAHIGPNTFNRTDWESVVKDYDGKILNLVRIYAVPEGTVVPTSLPLMVVYNDNPRFYWLTNFLETVLSNVWYSCTIATQSREMKRIIKNSMELSCDSLDGLDFKLHDFGCRGVTCPEQAAIGGAAHLINFRGTDTVPALQLIRKEYGMKEIAGYSIPASEHSTITSWGRDREVDAFRNMLQKYPTGLVACVSDSFDIYKACSDLWGGVLKDEVLQRDGTLVVRPDSGNPHVVLPEVMKILADKFGYTVNSKGYTVLNPKVRVIQGDGIDINSLETILKTLNDLKWSTDNIAFGSGGGLLQKVNRDTQKFAFKCSAIQVEKEYISSDDTGLNEWRDVYKDPITDKGKVSKKGLIYLRSFSGHHANGLGVGTVSNLSELTLAPDSMFVPYAEYDLEYNSVNNFDKIRERASL